MVLNLKYSICVQSTGITIKWNHEWSYFHQNEASSEQY
jgi:hypothetical protein